MRSFFAYRVDEVLLELHALADLRASLSEHARSSLASALKRKFRDMELEIASPTQGVSPIHSAITH